MFTHFQVSKRKAAYFAYFFSIMSTNGAKVKAASDSSLLVLCELYSTCPVAPVPLFYSMILVFVYARYDRKTGEIRWVSAYGWQLCLPMLHEGSILSFDSRAPKRGRTWQIPIHCALSSARQSCSPTYDLSTPLTGSTSQKGNQKSH